MSDQSNEPAGSPMDGGFRPMNEILPRLLASIPTPSPLASAITGVPQQAATPASTTGAQPGGTGVAARSARIPPVLKTFGLPEPAARLLPSLERLLVWAEASFYGSHGFDGVAVSAVAIRQNAPREEVRTLLAAFNWLCRDSPAELAAKKLAELRVLTAHRARDGVDVELMAGAYTERLAKYPPDVVVAACDAWADREEFWPTWAELKAECDRRTRGRVQIHEALRRAVSG